MRNNILIDLESKRKVSQQINKKGFEKRKQSKEKEKKKEKKKEKGKEETIKRTRA